MEQTVYQPGDLNQDGVIDEIEQYQLDQQMSVEDREQAWIEENLFPKGFSADKQTREIIGPDGQVVGKLPDFN